MQGVCDPLQPPEIQQSQYRGIYGLVPLVQAITELPFTENPRLWLVTQNAHELESATQLISPAQAPLWGLGRVIGYEHPELNCTCVDLDCRDAQAYVQLATEYASMTPSGCETGPKPQSLCPPGHVLGFVSPAEVPPRRRLHSKVDLEAFLCSSGSMCHQCINHPVQCHQFTTREASWPTHGTSPCRNPLMKNQKLHFAFKAIVCEGS